MTSKSSAAGLAGPAARGSENVHEVVALGCSPELQVAVTRDAALIAVRLLRQLHAPCYRETCLKKEIAISSLGMERLAAEAEVMFAKGNVNLI